MGSVIKILPVVGVVVLLLLLLFLKYRRHIMLQVRYGKRDLLIWQKRPTYMAKETYLYGKRDLLIWQKRPIYMALISIFYSKRTHSIVREHIL